MKKLLATVIFLGFVLSAWHSFNIYMAKKRVLDQQRQAFAEEVSKVRLYMKSSVDKLQPQSLLNEEAYEDLQLLYSSLPGEAAIKRVDKPTLVIWRDDLQRKKDHFQSLKKYFE